VAAAYCKTIGVASDRRQMKNKENEYLDVMMENFLK
jgi:hypothetical protein